MKRKLQPPEKTPLQRVSEDFGRFVYGKYVVGETAASDNEIAFDCGGELLVSVRVYEDHYDMILDGEVFPVIDMEAWEAVKERILAKKESDRVPFPKDTAVYSRCGMRCDLCVHYTGGTISDEFREELKRLLGNFWGPEDFGDDMTLCPGCFNKKDSKKCGKHKHARKQGLNSCMECDHYPCGNCGHVTMRIHPREAGNAIPADVITWALLPYAGGLN